MCANARDSGCNGAKHLGTKAKDERVRVKGERLHSSAKRTVSDGDKTA